MIDKSSKPLVICNYNGTIRVPKTKDMQLQQEIEYQNMKDLQLQR